MLLNLYVRYEFGRATSASRDFSVIPIYLNKQVNLNYHKVIDTTSLFIGIINKRRFIVIAKNTLTTGHISKWQAPSEEIVVHPATLRLRRVWSALQEKWRDNLRYRHTRYACARAGRRRRKLSHTNLLTRYCMPSEHNGCTLTCLDNYSRVRF